MFGIFRYYVTYFELLHIHITFIDIKLNIDIGYWKKRALKTFLGLSSSFVIIKCLKETSFHNFTDPQKLLINNTGFLNLSVTLTEKKFENTY